MGWERCNFHASFVAVCDAIAGSPESEIAMRWKVLEMFNEYSYNVRPPSDVNVGLDSPQLVRYQYHKHP